MTRGGTGPIAAFVAAVLAVGLIVACGDSDTTTSSTPASTAGGGSGDLTEKEGSSGSQGGGSQTKKDGSPQGSDKAGSENVATPLRVSGGGSAPFRNKGGDNSIQEYGEEGDESELQAAAEAVHGFYVARAEEDWGRACSYLAKSMVSQLKALVAQSSKLRDEDCAQLLKALTRPLPPEVRRETTVVDAGSLRRDDETGFLIYYGEDKVAFAIPLDEEDGEWKLTLLAPTPLG